MSHFFVSPAQRGRRVGPQARRRGGFGGVVDPMSSFEASKLPEPPPLAGGACSRLPRGAPLAGEAKKRPRVARC